MEAPIPESVARFLAAHVRSLEQLEILLLLAASPERVWTADSVNAVVRSSAASAAERLAELRALGLLAVDDSKAYRYAPPNRDVSAAVEELAHFYKERRVKIVEMIYAPPSDPVRGFADAFKLKKEK
jgi:hypothetical protein